MTIALIALSSCLFVLNLLPLIAIVNLLLFHLWLFYKGITTFEYIMSKREKQKELEEQIEALKDEIMKEEEKLRSKIINSNQFRDNPKDSKSILFESQA